jgi:Fic family protein
MYIWEQPDWPHFGWNDRRLAGPLAAARHQEGLLLGRMETLGFRLREEASLKALTEDVLKSSEIEGEKLDPAQVRSSIARRLGLDVAGLVPAERRVEGVVEMVLDATQKFEQPLTKERLFGWHAALFPTGRSGMTKITVGGWRDDKTGPMEVVSGPVGKERVHFITPPALRLDAEIDRFLEWFNGENHLDPVLKAGEAHLLFVTIHPFDDGNGRVARAVADMALARAENTRQRFYSMSSQIRQERNAYYDILEHTQKGALDITDWLEWFLGCFTRAVGSAQDMLGSVIAKARFWERHAAKPFNERQIKVLNRLLDGFEGNMTTSKWASIARCSQDTAHRDIVELVERGVLTKNASGGRSTSYSLVQDVDRN